jgi:hypothetical protein
MLVHLLKTFFHSNTTEINRIIYFIFFFCQAIMKKSYEVDMNYVTKRLKERLDFMREEIQKQKKWKTTVITQIDWTLIIEILNLNVK